MTSNDKIHPYLKNPLPKGIQETFDKIKNQKRGKPLHETLGSNTKTN